VSSPDAAAPARLDDWPRPVPPLALGALGTLLFAWSWGTWPDPTVDFGRELYAAWRLSEGARLYRDVAWLNGPLSPYFNALLFRVFGAHLLTLVFANAVVLAGVVTLLFRLLRVFSSRRAATVALAVFLAVFAFSQLMTIANHNFICPYSHEITHGFFLCCLATWLLHSSLVSGRLSAAFGAGAAVGLALLTKPETGLAAVAAGASYLALAPIAGRRPVFVASVLAGAVIPPVASVMLLASGSSLAVAIHDVTTPWRLVFDGRISQLAFYRMLQGLDRPAEHAAWLVACAGVYAALSLSVVLVAGRFRSRQTAELWSVPLAFGVFGALLLAAPLIPWYAGVAAMPLVSMVAVAAGAAASLRGPNRVAGTLLCALGMVSLALLAKIALLARTYHYGFVLAAPATLLFVVFLVDRLPHLAFRRGGSPKVAFALVSAVLAVWALHHVATTRAAFALKTTAVGQGADRFLADGRGDAVTRCVGWLQQHTPKDATVVVLPEGAMLNYLARRPSSVPWVTFMPPEVVAFSETRMLQALGAAPPSAIVLVHKDTTDYGYPLFGRDYGQAIMNWVRANYERALLVGEEPLRDPARFGAEVLVRRDGSPTARESTAVR
jgi:hypothetical protein